MDGRQFAFSWERRSGELEGGGGANVLWPALRPTMRPDFCLTSFGMLAVVVSSMERGSMKGRLGVLEFECASTDWCRLNVRLGTANLSRVEPERRATRTSTTPSRSEHHFILVDIADKSTIMRCSSGKTDSFQRFVTRIEYIRLVAFDSAHFFGHMRKFTASYTLRIRGKTFTCRYSLVAFEISGLSLVVRGRPPPEHIKV
jgi:hypothetical protein